MSWPPRVGEVMPRAEEASGVRWKLASYSLNPEHERGGPKARGFERILGVTIDDLDYLGAAIESGIAEQAVTAVRDNEPFGFLCEVNVPVRGIGQEAPTVDVTTAWELLSPEAPPRLVSAYIRS